jgi:hypothetical protein
MSGLPHVFVIAMENENTGGVFGSGSAPYINGVLIPRYASAADFADELPALASEPHYVWMEAGTNAFADHTFTTDAPPSASNSTASTAHLTAQIRAAGGGLDWMAYEEGIAAGACPIVDSGLYATRHNPFIFFRDIAGSPPSAGAATCAAHHRPLSALAGDLAAGAVASYVFITPNLCHDMHGSAACAGADLVRLGDNWLSGTMPALTAYIDAHGGVVFITWDEGSPMPFLAVGPGVKPGYRSTTRFNHGSLLRTVERLLGLPALPAVAGASDLGELFTPGALP